ncbi:hypothetical protein Tsubulata_021514 [Turnera subulata]|uniref:BUD13 homolog n=1 Tax=Turnera subulata TaxID=218843 RepID=A0A9Q0FRV6_9ROSI|nr:hypothetical protein Tsubulata_021514 [Turnera subulata]
MASSLKEYLKRYQSPNEAEEEKKKKKKKKKKENNTRSAGPGVLVVDEDPVWQKPVRIEDEEEENDSADEEKPVVDEDIEVKRMKRLEALRARRPYNAIAEDGSGWVTVPAKSAADSGNDMSPPRRGRTRNDTPSPERSGKDGAVRDLSTPRRSRARNDSPSPERDGKGGGEADLSPPRRRTRNDTPSAEPSGKPDRDLDLSPPRRRRETEGKEMGGNVDLSPPRRRRVRDDSPSQRQEGAREDSDMSPPRRRRRYHTPSPGPVSDLSPPRKSRSVQRGRSPDLSPQRKRHSTEVSVSRASAAQDLSPPRKNRKESLNPPPAKEQPKTGLITGRDMQDEIFKTKKVDLMRFAQMDPSMSGRGAEPVYRDKKTGQRISKEEFLKPKQKIEEKPKEIKLEWGQGLAQKREAEARLQELEVEKEKPFARTRDDPELDKMLKDRLRWGDPMAHLVKKKHSEPALQDLGNNEKMKESGFIIPQDIPSHSWITRRLEPAPNRYGIRPGRHWDGVDRSNGFEKQMFKRMNEKRATETEAYLWSVSDM